MPIRIGSNLPLMQAFQRSYVSQSGSDRSSLLRGTSTRLPTQSLDAATITLADSLRTRSGIMAQTARSVSDAQSLLSIAEAALDEIDAITTRLGELATAATTETLSQSQRQALQEESNALTREYNTIVATTEYKGTKILDQAGDALQINLGNGATGTIATPLIAALSRTTGSGVLTNSQSLATASNSTDILLLDINGDGYQDLVATLTGRSELNVRFGSSDGTFAGITTVAGGGTTGGILAKGDIDNDGDEDVARLGTPAGSKTRIQIYRNTGSGLTLITDTQESGISSVDSLALADLTGDGRADVIFGSVNAGQIYTKRMLASGNMGARQSVASVNLAFSMAVGDFNQDGKQDLLVRDSLSLDGEPMSPTLYTGNGSGGFPVATYFSGITGNNRLVSGDFNQDGFLDFTITDGTSTKVALGYGGINFSESASVSGLQANVTADFDGDGILDLIEGAFGSLKVAKGRGDGTFANVQTISGVTRTPDAYVDLNGDGALDVIQRGVSIETLIQGVTTTTSMASLNLIDISGATTAVTTTTTLGSKVESQINTIKSAKTRLEGVFESVSNQRRELASAADRIVTIGQAESDARFLADRVRKEATEAVFAQANQLPDVALALLKEQNLQATSNTTKSVLSERDRQGSAPGLPSGTALAASFLVSAPDYQATSSTFGVNSSFPYGTNDLSETDSESTTSTLGLRLRIQSDD